MSSSALARVDSATSRLNALVESMAAREAERLEAERADRAGADAARAKADTLRRVEIADRYDSAFRAFGERVPMPAGDEKPGVFRARLFETLRCKLPSTNEWSGTRADDIPPSARSQIESLVISAAMAEGLKPSVENLPANGELVRRERVDDMGQRSIEWAGRESFIKQLSSPLKQKVVRICDPRKGIVLTGLPFSRQG